jgi:hypothetical protein
MCSLKSPWPAHALTTLETVLKQPQEARLFRRAHAVCAVVAGSHVNVVSAMCHLTNSALRTWGQRFANAGPRAGWIAHAPGARAKAPPHSKSTSTHVQGGRMNHRIFIREESQVKSFFSCKNSRADAALLRGWATSVTSAGASDGWARPRAWRRTRM